MATGVAQSVKALACRSEVALGRVFDPRLGLFRGFPQPLSIEHSLKSVQRLSRKLNIPCSTVYKVLRFMLKKKSYLMQILHHLPNELAELVTSLWGFIKGCVFIQHTITLVELLNRITQAAASITLTMSQKFFALLPKDGRKLLKDIPPEPRRLAVASFLLNTEHDILGKHLNRLGILPSASCILCHQQEDMDRQHIAKCPALKSSKEVDRYWEARARMGWLASHKMPMYALDQACRLMPTGASARFRAQENLSVLQLKGKRQTKEVVYASW
ncbi:hypothetical protein ANN_23452 [Periplaneta americana]|uniref:Uncharacterized protein n=1 Tax=Periplaneta americana TaxID=6978 RepID=A0ABQ8SM63_PERAM|nr:hypothetical protein ANN_23452 [Periplaneta americana]